jgi:serine acetyltransferase
VHALSRLRPIAGLLGALSLVNEDLPDRAICAGIPGPAIARSRRLLLNQTQITENKP